MRILITILVLFLTTQVHSQVLQENATNSTANRWVIKVGTRMPQTDVLPARPNLYNYTGDSASGALVYCKCPADTTKRGMYFWKVDRWIRLDSAGSGGSGSGIQSVTGIAPIHVDTTDPANPIVSYTGDTTRVFIFEPPIQALTYGDTIYVYFDSTLHNTTPFLDGRYYPLTLNPAHYLTLSEASGAYVDTGYTRGDTIYLAKNGFEFPIGILPDTATLHGRGVLSYAKNGTNDSTILTLNDGSRFAASDRSGSSSGGLSQVIADWGLLNVNDSTLKVDSFLVASRARVDKVADSLGVIIATKVPLIRTITINGTAYDLSANRTWSVGTLSTGVYQIITATAGQTAFTFTSVPTTSATYNVFINGSVCPKSYYSVASNTITFSAGLTLNDVIMIQGVQ